LIIAWILALGCASGPENRPKVSYRVSAKENFIKGKKAFDDEDYLEAIEYFRFVKNKFPYSSYATDADLLIGDCHYGRERFIEAADAYLNFIKLHPKHEKVPYAAFRMGLSYFNRIPDDWWFSPPAFEMDQTETVRAIRELENYLGKFPDDEHAAEARKLLAQCKRRMAERVHFVMRFNLSKDRYRGALWRAQELLGNYPGAGFDEEALLVKAEALIELGDPAGAQAAVQELLARFPQTQLRQDAQKLLARLPAGAAALERDRESDGQPDGKQVDKPDSRPDSVPAKIDGPEPADPGPADPKPGGPSS
jgi:outer membrane protein assembly factor BamD